MHAALGVLVFFPLLLGRTLIAGTDVLFNHVPNLFFGLREWQRWHEIPLWNPYVFNGLDQSSSIHSPYLNPVFGWIALLPEPAWLWALSLLLAALTVAVGLLWTAIAKKWGVPGPSAMIVGVVAQLSAAVWWLQTTLVLLPTFLGTTLVLLLLMGARNRPLWTNAALLVPAIFLILVTPHPASWLGALITVLVFLAVRNGAPTRASFRKEVVLLLLAGTIALGLTAYR